MVKDKSGGMWLATKTDGAFYLSGDNYKFYNVEGSALGTSAPSADITILPKDARLRQVFQLWQCAQQFGKLRFCHGFCSCVVKARCTQLGRNYAAFWPSSISSTRVRGSRY